MLYDSDIQRQKAIVKYQIASYSGEETVYCDANQDDEDIIAKAKRQIYRGKDSFPFGVRSFRVIEREDYFGD